ncbi:recombinase family protein [Nocardia sp. NBC_01730]|nr:recombinase family protein [Nocardia sp. NBC_01730]
MFGTTRKKRAGLDNALAAVTSAAAAVADRQVVLSTTKFDRFARNMAEAGDILTGLRNRDVLFGPEGRQQAQRARPVLLAAAGVIICRDPHRGSRTRARCR